MNIDRFFTQEATVTHPAEVAAYGGTTYDYANGTTETVMGWFHQQSASEQQNGTLNANISTHVFRCPAGSNITTADRVTIGGITFEVDGPPVDEPTPDGPHHRRVGLRFMDA